jgi:porphobilinogen deaminase
VTISEPHSLHGPRFRGTAARRRGKLISSHPDMSIVAIRANIDER